MLTHLSFSIWTGRIKDNKVSEEVTINKYADKDSGTWWTYLVPRGSMRNINTAYNRCKSVHNMFTLPWRDGGTRILPASMFTKYSKAMRKVKAEFDEAVDEFLREYPNIVANARKRLGSLLDDRKLPDVSEVKTKFGVHQEIFPLPDTDDFRVKLSEEDADEIRKKMKTSINDTVEKAMAGVWSRLANLVEKVEKTLGEPKKKFKNSLIDNLKEFCELIPKLNLTEDSKLEVFRKEITEKLANLKPNELRENETERKAAHKAAKDVLEKMNSYMNI